MNDKGQMKKTPKVAVITRTKDRHLFLERAIESTQQQKMKDFVQIILNDGGSKDAVEKIVKKHPENIKLIHNEKPAGHTKALNQAIQYSDSEYIAILDDDDTWHPDYLTKTTEHLDKTGAKGVVAVIDRVIEKINGDTIEFVSKDRWRPDIDAVSLYGQCLDNYAPTVAFVYRRSVYEELEGYDETLGVSEDWDFALRFLLKYDIDFLNTKEALTNYHHRPEAKGAEGNSVFATVDKHKYHMNLLANRYLRNDIEQGKMGVGFIINNLRWQRDIVEEKQKQWQNEQTVRLEGHVNYATEELRKSIKAETVVEIKAIEDRRYINRLKRRVRRNK